jgi:regulator of sigma E protease
MCLALVMISFLMSILAFVVVLSPLVFVHELGHYWAAKACGVHVERFSIGFGPRIFSWKDKSGTEWVFSWILLGGYVQMLGDANVASSVSKKTSQADHGRTMAGKTHLQRIIIAAAGPAVNYVVAFIMFVALFVTLGKPYHSPTIGTVGPTSQAYLAGVRPGDRIEDIKGAENKIATFEDVLKVLAKTPATEPLQVSVMRGDQERLNLTIMPEEKASGIWLGKLKCTPEKSTGFYQKKSFRSAISDTLDMLNPVRMVQSLRLDSMGGPISIAHQAGNVLQEGLFPVFFLMASLSLGLGFFNLIPLPVLDGGLIMMEAIEWIIGRKLPDGVRQGISIAAFGVLAMLLVFLSWSDLGKIPAVEAIFSSFSR